MYDHTHYPMVRPDTLDHLDAYAQAGVPVGGFLEAVLTNDLMRAVSNADQGNHLALREICWYVYNELPGPCHGSPEAYWRWPSTPGPAAIRQVEAREAHRG